MQPDFSIGQLAQLFDVPVATLRYYDEIGLLKPARVDPKSHYRYYATEQFERLSTIKYFRALGVSLTAIADFFAARELPKLTTLLTTQSEQVEQQLQLLQAIQQRIKNRLAQIKTAQIATYNVTELVQLPVRTMVALQQQYRPQDDIELVIAKLREQYGLANSIFLGKIALMIDQQQLQAGQFDQYTGICLLFEAGDQLPAQQQQLSGGTYAQLTFRGTHLDAPRYYQQLVADCQRLGWSIQGAAIETALIDYGITDQVEQSVTRIQLPIKN
ncbi:MerR family transcriptional regulator [Lactiplantibacillus herbarum]|uniref:MerR family transcriptional regulator n=1 Tax=Lactiplantibacillus herbarum TaxID=1670446 RepID=UPI00064FEC18|nr:MerR family transcriptional regulator [Lactiplantibacillus herbarum]